jgi:hypothetical protein
MLRALIVQSYGRAQMDTEVGTAGHRAMLLWQAAVVVNDEQCDAALPLQQFAELVYIQRIHNEQSGPITAAHDASVRIVSADASRYVAVQ